MKFSDNSKWWANGKGSFTFTNDGIEASLHIQAGEEHGRRFKKDESAYTIEKSKVICWTVDEVLKCKIDIDLGFKPRKLSWDSDELDSDCDM